MSAESGAAIEAVAASVAALAALAGAAASDDAPAADLLGDGDPLRRLADGCLDGLAEVARLEARTAALRVRLTADYAQATRFLAPPAPSPRDRAAQAMALVAEVACVLTVSERTAAALLAEARALTTALPLTLAALESGAISWAHARILVDETASLDAAGAAALEAHFLDPGAPNPARGCPAGDLVPSRFRAKARAWRERHHPAGIEERHATSAADRLHSEYLPALCPQGTDPLGCGDALLATATLTLAAGGSLQAAALLGSIAAALEVREVGNVPVGADQIRRHLYGAARDASSIAA